MYRQHYQPLVRFLHRQVWDAERAQDLAQRRPDCTANRVALAWLLQQPCPLLPIIGPLALQELSGTFPVF